MRKQVYVVGTYDGRTRWAIARFPVDDEEPPRGPYRVGTLVVGGISFKEREFSNREDAEAYLVYNLDEKVKL